MALKVMKKNKKHDPRKVKRGKAGKAMVLGALKTFRMKSSSLHPYHLEMFLEQDVHLVLFYLLNLFGVFRLYPISSMASCEFLSLKLAREVERPNISRGFKCWHWQVCHILCYPSAAWCLEQCHQRQPCLRTHTLMRVCEFKDV